MPFVFQLFLLNVERGDLAAVKRIVSALSSKKNIFDIDCVDPLGRSGLVIAIENENLELMQYLLEAGIQLRVRCNLGVIILLFTQITIITFLVLGWPSYCYQGRLCRWR